MFELRFWKEGVNIKVAGRYSHTFSYFEDAWNFAQVFLSEAYLKGADGIDINNDFYPIFDDEDEDDEEDLYDDLMQDIDGWDRWEIEPSRDDWDEES